MEVKITVIDQNLRLMFDQSATMSGEIGTDDGHVFLTVVQHGASYRKPRSSVAFLNDRKQGSREVSYRKRKRGDRGSLLGGDEYSRHCEEAWVLLERGQMLF